MKRLFRNTLTASLIAIVGLVGIGGCDKKYNAFEKHIRAKESFLYVINQQDNQAWQKTNENVWSKLTNPKNSQSFSNQIKDKNDYSPESLFKDPDSDLAKKYQNMHFYTLQIGRKDNVFENKTVKSILKYIIQKTEKHLSRPGYDVKNLTRQKIGITDSPLFLFFAAGDYKGFFQGGVKTIIHDDKKQEVKGDYSMMYLIMKHIVLFNWMAQDKN